MHEISKSDSTLLFKKKFPTSEKNKARIISLIREKLSEIRGRICIDILELNLILDEAIINAMEHGNRWDPSKNIMIRLSHDTMEVQIEIEDEGQGFDYGRKFPDEENRSLANHRGRGLFLIQQICEIEWTNTGNIIKIHIPIESEA